MAYKPATINDLDKLSELVLLYCKEINYNADLESIKQSLKMQLTHTVAYVAEGEDGDIVGVISFAIMPNPFNHHEKIGRKINAFVREDYRNKGVGSDLLELAEMYCKSEGATKFYYTGKAAPKDYLIHEIDYVKEL